MQVENDAECVKSGPPQHIERRHADDVERPGLRPTDQLPQGGSLAQVGRELLVGSRRNVAEGPPEGLQPGQCMPGVGFGGEDEVQRRPTA
jgi:hypothetical protein